MPSECPHFVFVCPTLIPIGSWVGDWYHFQELKAEDKMLGYDNSFLRRPAPWDVPMGAGGLPVKTLSPEQRITARLWAWESLEEGLLMWALVRCRHVTPLQLAEARGESVEAVESQIHKHEQMKDPMDLQGIGDDLLPSPIHERLATVAPGQRQLLI